MNGLALRINRGGGGKSKNSIGCSPIAIPTSLFENTVDNYTEIQAFIKSASTDDQLVILKKLLDTNKDSTDNVVMKFLVAAFFHAEAKHPIKCFISRHITRNNDLQQPFSDALALQITEYIMTKPSDYKQYVDIVSKSIMCIENFNAGVAAVRMIEVTLAKYLRDCLECCVKTLSEQKTLSPTEKNEIFNLAHLALRLLLHIVQKANTDNISKLILMFDAIRLLIQDLMFDDDVPMDTKSVCGILYLTMHVTENGADSWIEVLNSTSTNSALNNLLSLEAGRLSLYSAIVTVVTVDHLFTQTVNDGPAIINLTKKILHIGERSSSESAFILGVARTVLQISKLLDKLTDSSTGLTLVESLLMFAWGHLEHYMDSVRHLTGQMLACVVKYSAKMDANGDTRALELVCGALGALGRARRGYYVGVACAAPELPPRRLRALARAPDLLRALQHQRLHNTARAALEALLERLGAELAGAELRADWLQPSVRLAAGAGAPLLAALEHVLARACCRCPALLHHVLAYIKEASDPNSQNYDLKCVLMLLRVVRKSGGSALLPGQPSDNEWKGIISYDLLQQAAVDAVDETRILSLSLIVESPKSTELFSEGDLRFVLYYLKFNINAQAPNFRQLTLSAMKKFIKRLEESYKVVWRQMHSNGMSDKVAYYLRFAEDLRRQCFDSLIPGANYSRRFVALQILAWCEQITLDGYERSWEPDYVEKLLLLLEDSYENNKAFALEVLASCPVHLLKSKKYSISLEIEDIFDQASSLKPTECVSAAYKLELLTTRLPEYILQGEQCATQVSAARRALARRLAARARAQLAACARSVLAAAARAPVYGMLHCLAQTLRHVDALAISTDEHWTALICDVIDICMEVNAAVACVVNNSSPEGHLPMDMTVQITDHGNSGNVTLEDGRQVTAQMVLLCAWRSVKEVSLLLGGLCALLTVRGEGEGEGGTLCPAQLERVGEHFTSLLAETKHRGAFEQAYVGFTLLLDRLWRCRSPELHELPRRWLEELMRAIASDDSEGSLCATRRSAGVPFMIQALVTTEVQVQGNPLCFHGCMSSLLQLARCGQPAARGHALHVLRALFRHAALAERVAPYVARGLVAALHAFDAHSWAERNSSTLLLSALVQRVFGVQRSTMTGRIFFLRYPEVYDFMLEKLQEVSMKADSHVLRPSLYPVLLLLARLYPSSLEGTVSCLKLVAFIPHVLACAKSSVLKTRQLAAKAIVPLISPEQYIPHIEAMFKLIHDVNIERNYCHGILLQLSRLLARGGERREWRGACAAPGAWPLRQAAGSAPCYLVADEYIKLLNLLLMRFPTLPQETLAEISSCLHTLIFDTKPNAVSPGRDICLSNAMYLYFILASKYHLTDINDLVYKGLEHSSYEVVLSVLNYLLTLHNDLETETCKFHEHLISIADKSVLNKIKNEKYIQLLCKILKNNYLECQEKSLKILMLEGNTQRNIIETKMGVDVADDNIIIEKLFECIQNEHENLTHIYLQSLLNFITNRLQDSSLCVRVLLDVIRVIFECSSSENSENTRRVVVGFLETNICQLLVLDLSKFSEADGFEVQATIWATIITLLEDDDADIRQRVSSAASAACGAAARLAPPAARLAPPAARLAPPAARLAPPAARLAPPAARLAPPAARLAPPAARLVPPATALAVRAHLRRSLQADVGPAMFALLALLDFQSVVLVAEDVSDECRVFDQNERYNIFLEETVWTIACADIITNDYKINEVVLCTIIDKPAYRGTFAKLCKDNVEMFRKMVAGHKIPRNDALNPKIELFVNRLCKLNN